MVRLPRLLMFAGALILVGVPLAVPTVSADQAPPAGARRLGPPVDLSGGYINGVSFTQDGSRIALLCGWPTARVVVWDMKTGRPATEVRVLSAADAVILPGGDTVVTVSANDNLSFWDLSTKQLLYTRGRNGKESTSQNIVVSPDGRTVCATVRHEERPYAHRVTFWETASGLVRRRLFSEARGEWGAAYAFSPDSGSLLVAYDDTPRVFDLASGKTTAVFDGFRKAPKAAAFSPDGRRVAIIGSGYVFHDSKPDDRLVSLHDARTGKTLFRWDTKEGARDEECVTFCLSGRVVATANHHDPVIRLRHAGTGELVHTLRWDIGGVGGLACSPDGNLLASSHGNGTLLLWDLTALESLRDLKPLPPPEKGAPAAGEKPLADKELDALWADLVDASGVKAYDAIGEFVEHPTSAVPFLRERLKAIAALKPERVARLLRDLDSDEFDTRTQAQEELTKLAPQIAPRLRKELEATPSAEVKRSLALILETLQEPVLDAAKLRTVRAAEALERIGTSEALDVLRRLSTGDADAWETRDAKLAVERLARRRALMAPPK